MEEQLLRLISVYQKKIDTIEDYLYKSDCPAGSTTRLLIEQMVYREIITDLRKIILMS